MTVRILTGDVRERLAELPDESVHCVVTSPPYFGLRDYGTAQWDGGDPDCDHEGAPKRTQAGFNERYFGKEFDANKQSELRQPYQSVCGKCGATRIDNQIGLEPTLTDYIDTMTAVFRDVRRVLRSDGVCWLNIGDSSRDKQLLMVPARLALALQADGWWLRSDIIWWKPNQMPESVTDRPTNAHEHIFLLTKSARYWYDADAVREQNTAGTIDRLRSGPVQAKSLGPKNQIGRQDGGTAAYAEPNGANLRNVWSISTQGFPGAHFATFPPEIPRRCIKAGTSEKGACSACGAPWSRVVERNEQPKDRMSGRGWLESTEGVVLGRKTEPNNGLGRDHTMASITTGWQPGCTCDADVIPCTVMDIFFGAGTTGLVADQLGRDCIGIELNPAYAAMAEDRIRGAAPMFAEVTLGTA